MSRSTAGVWHYWEIDEFNVVYHARDVYTSLIMHSRDRDNLYSENREFIKNSNACIDQIFLMLSVGRTFCQDKKIKDMMYLWRKSSYCYGSAAHIWRITRVSYLSFGCCDWANTLRFNKFHKRSIGFKPDFLKAIEVLARCLLHTLPVRYLLSDMVRCHVPTSYRDWHGCEQDRPNDIVLIPCRVHVSLNGFNWGFRVHGNPSPQ